MWPPRERSCTDDWYRNRSVALSPHIIHTSGKQDGRCRNPQNQVDESNLHRNASDSFLKLGSNRWKTHRNWCFGRHSGLKVVANCRKTASRPYKYAESVSPNRLSDRSACRRYGPEVQRLMHTILHLGWQCFAKCCYECQRCCRGSNQWYRWSKAILTRGILRNLRNLR